MISNKSDQGGGKSWCPRDAFNSSSAKLSQIGEDRAILLADLPTSSFLLPIKRADYILINKEFVVRPLPLPLTPNPFTKISISRPHLSKPRLTTSDTRARQTLPFVSGHVYVSSGDVILSTIEKIIRIGRKDGRGCFFLSFLEN